MDLDSRMVGKAIAEVNFQKNIDLEKDQDHGNVIQINFSNGAVTHKPSTYPSNRPAPLKDTNERFTSLVPESTKWVIITSFTLQTQTDNIHKHTANN